MGKNANYKTNREWLHDLLKSACEQTGRTIRKILADANLSACSFCMYCDICEATNVKQNCGNGKKTWLKDRGLNEDIPGTHRNHIKSQIQSAIEYHKGYTIYK